MALASLIFVAFEKEHAPFSLPRCDELEGFYKCILHFTFLLIVFGRLEACAKEEEGLHFVIIIAYRKDNEINVCLSKVLNLPIDIKSSQARSNFSIKSYLSTFDLISFVLFVSYV